ESDGGIVGAVVYARELFDAATAARLVAHWTTALAAMVAAPATTVAGVALEDAAAAAARTAFEDGGPSLAPIDVVTAVTAQAARTPHARAVRDAHETVTYAALQRRVTAVAAALTAAGVGPEVAVGVWGERTVAW